MAGDSKREKSPTVATMATATAMSTPGIVIRRRVLASSSAKRASSASTSFNSAPAKSNWRSNEWTVRRSSAGSCLIIQPPSPLDPEQIGERATGQQVPGQDGLHLVLHPGAVGGPDAKCWPTWRRNALVASSACHTDGR